MKRILLLFVTLANGYLFATQPPDPGAIQKFIQDGSFEARLKFVKEVGNHRVRADVAQRTLMRLQHGVDKPTRAPLPNWQGMPPKGTNKVLALLVDFPDYAHVNAASVVTNKLFGNGIPGEYPKESLRNYYIRSSYNQLFIEGNVLGWYRMQHERSWYTTQYPNQNDANRAVILEVLQAFDGTHDFSQYDNNGDGEVDYFAVIWSGPDNGWGNFWWGYQWQLFNPITLDGVRFTDFSWQWESRPVGTSFHAETIIHETGHAIGLPDYYDYDPNQGPGGGVGGLDMMAGAYADHNAFSKFMLEWLTPQAIQVGSSNLSLRALARSPDAIAIMPDYNGLTPYTEYFMIENRFRTNNDTGAPGNGLLVWHVDATPNARGEDFLFDNSYTPHKLLRLMEADGLEEIEFGDGRADAGDYYNLGQSFGENTVPNSRAYNGSESGVTVDAISADAFLMNARFAIEGIVTGPRIRRSPDSLTQATLADVNPPSQSFAVWATGGTLAYAISDDAPWISVLPDNGASSGATNTHALSYSVAGLSPGTYNATVTITAPDATNSPQTLAVTLTIMGNNIGRAVDATNLVWTAGGNSLWFEQTTVGHDGIDAAQSGTLGDSQTNWIQTTVQGPGQLSFWWKVSSEQGYDFLRFMVDGVDRVQPISGSGEWLPATVFVASGSHTLRWVYAKDFSIGAGSDAAWVDQVEFVPSGLSPTIGFNPAGFSQIAGVGQNAPSQTLQIFNGGGGTMSYTVNDDAAWLSVTPSTETSSGAPNSHTVSYSSSALAIGVYTATITITASGATNSPRTVPVSLQVLSGGTPLAEAVDFPTTVWATGGNADWLPQTTFTHDGEDAAANGDITHDQVSWLETTVEGPGQLTFWWKASTETGYDSLSFFLDQNWTGLRIDGESDWRQETQFVPAGTHMLGWAYAKDGSVDFGADTVWLDQVSFTPGGIAPETLMSADFTGGLPAGWQIVDNAFSGAIWRFNDPCNAGNITGGIGTFAIADSDCEGQVPMDTELISPSVNFSGYTNVLLEFKSDFAIYTSEIADVDVQINGGAWINVWRRTADDWGPKTYRIIVPQADNQPDVRVRFHYHNAFFELYWGVDDVALIGNSTIPPARNYLPDWRQVWDDFDQNYSYFTHKGIDWASVYDANTNLFGTVSNATDFAVQLNNVLQVLHDWHVTVKKPDNTWLGYNGAYTNNFPSQPITIYSGGVAYENLNGANAIYHAWVFTNLAHVVVTTLDDAAFAAISDTDINNLFETYKDAQGFILDLRPNSGGNETNALRFAGRFTPLPRVYGYTRTRIPGNDHDALTPFAAKILQPSPGTRFTNNVTCLIGQKTIDSGEWLTLMMQTCPQVTLIGDRTRGSTANEEVFTQAAINVSYQISRWIGYTSAQIPFEGAGIAPAVALPPGDGSFNEPQQRDYVLESAASWLRRPRLDARRRNPSGIIVEWPAGIGSTYTLLRSTNLQPASWFLAPGWTSNRAGINGLMSYTNASPTGREFYRLQIGP